MKYAQIRKMDITNGEGIGVSLFTQGCPFHCKNCFNPETWDFNKGIEYTKETEDKIIELLKPDYIKRLTILGGEPLIERNIEPLTDLFIRVKELYPEKQIWLYTGSNFELESVRCDNLIKHTDVIIDGRYIDKLRDLTLKFRGSSNQRVIDVQKSLKAKEIVLWCD